MSVKTCTTQKKRCYQTQFQAENAMVKSYKKKRIKTFGSYYHKGCGYWHLTSMYDNRTPSTLQRFEDMHRPPNPPKPKQKMQLTRQEIHEAMLQLQKERTGIRVPMFRGWRVWLQTKLGGFDSHGARKKKTPTELSG